MGITDGKGRVERIEDDEDAASFAVTWKKAAAAVESSNETRSPDEAFEWIGR